MLVCPPIITVDGPSCAGKSTLCKTLAYKFGWKLLDSGAVYRVLALAALHHHVNVQSEEELVHLATNLDIRFELNEKELSVIFEGKDVSSEIRTEIIGNTASITATFLRVRTALLSRQKEFHTNPGLIADGRDMGTVVFPNAPVKIFLDAKIEERAYRRTQQLQEEGFNVTFNNLLVDIKDRDYRDHNRIISPLVPAKDALILDSTQLSTEQVIKKALAYVKKNKYYLYNMLDY